VLVLRRLAIAVLLVGTVVVGSMFVVANRETIQIEFPVGGPLQVETWLALLVAFGIGAALATALCLFEVARYGLVARRYRKTAARLEAEVHQLRTLPLADEVTAPRTRGEVESVGPPGGLFPGGG
jgi:uncharacterized integral membrane protein